MVEQPRRHFRVWDAAKDAKVAVVAARLFVVRQMLNHHALILDGLHRLNRELVMLMHRANPFARSAQHHALTRYCQPFAVYGVGKHEACICAALGVLADEIRAAQQDVVRVAPKAVCAGREVVCRLPRLGEIVNVRPIFVPRRVPIFAGDCTEFLACDVERVVRFRAADSAHNHDLVRDWREAGKASLDVFLDVADDETEGNQRSPRARATRFRPIPEWFRSGHGRRKVCGMGIHKPAFYAQGRDTSRHKSAGPFAKPGAPV